MTETDQSKAGDLHSKTGVVSAVSGDKSIRVEVSVMVKHQRYGKYVRCRTKLMVHDPDNEASVGDLVEIAPCRPVSKRKSWRLVRVIRHDRAMA